MRANKQLGFTLIELLIAISIFSLIAITSYTSLSNFNKSSINLQKNIKEIQSLQTLMLFLDRDFSQVYNQEIVFKDNNITIDSLQNNKIIRINYSFNEDNIVRSVDVNTKKAELTLIKNISKVKVRLLDNKNKWLLKWKKINGKHITAIEIKFDSIFGEIIKLVMIDE